MAREEKTAEEIRDEVERLIHGVREVREDKLKIRVPLPTPLAQLDPNGCNWTMEYFGNPGPHLEACWRARNEVQERWNLSGAGLRA